MIAIIDYGVGNLFSLRSSLKAVNEECIVTNDREQIHDCDRIILPGVGAFGDAMAKLKASGMDAVVKEEAADGKKLLGICVGMQMLFEMGCEFGEHEGLGLIKGYVDAMSPRLSEHLDIPHMGWNPLHIVKPDCMLFDGIEENDCMYFVHSYAAFDCDDAITATCEYGLTVTAAVQSGNVFGTQFHPEKSGEKGLRILKNFCTH